MVENEGRLVYKPEQARKLIGCSRTVIYELLHQNLVPNLKIGARYIIPRAAFHRWLEEAASQQKQGYSRENVVLKIPK